MPKKNGFVMYLDSRKQSLLDAGHELNGSYRQLIDLCGDEWEKLSKLEKKTFSDAAKAYNEQKVAIWRGAFGVGDKLRSLTSELPQPGQPPIQKAMTDDVQETSPTVP